ncbi:MAG TPA: hypothetical protein VGM56_00830 [Byssovorax sp.]
MVFVACVGACAVSVPELSVAGSGDGGASASSDGAGGGSTDCSIATQCTGPACACEPTAASGSAFLGPVLFAVTIAPVDCPTSFPTRSLTGATVATAPDAACKACACDSLPCGAAGVRAYGDGGCASPPASVTTPAETCLSGFGVPFHSVRVTDAPASASVACTPSGGGVQDPLPAMTRDYAVVCSGTVGPGCASDSVCIPAPLEPFEVCMLAEGSVSCPHDYPKQNTLYEQITDTRTCSDCGCGDPGATCPTTFDAFASASCTTPIGSGASNTCFAPANTGSSLLAHVASPCPTTGGAPRGTIELSMPYTVCCL